MTSTSRSAWSASGEGPTGFARVACIRKPGAKNRAVKSATVFSRCIITVRDLFSAALFTRCTNNATDRRQPKGARDWLERLRCANPTLFAHWPLCHGNGPNIGSRVIREGHARFWERLGVKFLRATRPLQTFAREPTPSAHPNSSRHSNLSCVCDSARSNGAQRAGCAS
jgi:hypothetical protein